ncbi:MAG: recombinase family protein [Minisyncoccia bacterium]
MEIGDQYKDKYLIYNRKSTDDKENQKNSLTYQSSLNQEYARKHNLPIADLTIERFCEKGVINESHSGYKEDDDFDIGENGIFSNRVLRPKFVKLIRLLKDKKIKGVVILCWDRASRNAQDNVIIQRLVEQGCDIRFTDMQFDKNSGGKVNMNVQGMFAEYYSDVISEKVRYSQEKLRAEGKCIYSVPLGYLNRGSDNKPIDPERAPLIKRLFEMYATGEWSFMQLAKWATKNGLTKRPKRRKRTKEEQENGIDFDLLPKVSGPIDHKSVESILSNPFYIGKVKIGHNEYITSTAHKPIIDSALFIKVQEVLKKRSKTIRYIDKPFFAYRGMANCTCGRCYSPYPQKGYTYYRSRCKLDCDNPDVNISEKELTSMFKNIIDGLYFTDPEIADIESKAKKELAIIAGQRDKKLSDLYNKHREVSKNIEFLTENRITLMRTKAMVPEDIVAEETRLNGSRIAIEEEIKVYGESAQDMLKFVITFSELIKNASIYFDHALDSEKREIVTLIFSEIVIKDRKLLKYSLKEGFEALVGRKRVSGGDGWIRTIGRV